MCSVYFLFCSRISHMHMMCLNQIQSYFLPSNSPRPLSLPTLFSTASLCMCVCVYFCLSACSLSVSVSFPTEFTWCCLYVHGCRTLLVPEQPSGGCIREGNLLSLPSSYQSSTSPGDIMSLAMLHVDLAGLVFGRSWARSQGAGPTRGHWFQLFLTMGVDAHPFIISILFEALLWRLASVFSIALSMVFLDVRVLSAFLFPHCKCLSSVASSLFTPANQTYLLQCRLLLFVCLLFLVCEPWHMHVKDRTILKNTYSLASLWGLQIELRSPNVYKYSQHIC